MFWDRGGDVLRIIGDIPAEKMTRTRIRQSGQQRRCELAEITNVTHMAGAWPTSRHSARLASDIIWVSVLETVKGKYLECVKCPQTESRGGAALSPSSQRPDSTQGFSGYYPSLARLSFRVSDFGLERVERRCPEKYRSRGRSITQRQSLDTPPLRAHGPRLW